MKYIIRKMDNETDKITTELITKNREEFLKNIKKYFNEKKAGICWLDLLGDIEFMEYMANITGKNYLTNFKIDEYNNKIFYGVSFGEV